MKKNINLFLFTLVGFCLVFSSCKDGPKPDAKPKVKVAIPSFDGQGAFDYVQKQVDFGVRVPGTETHVKCKDWLIEELGLLGANVQVQEFKASFLTVKDVDAYNIIASINPKKKNRVLLAAHWDTRLIADKDDEDQDKPIDGADDGGSGVGVLLQIAKTIKDNPIDLGVDIILFDAEDNGFDTDDGSKTATWCLGSQYWMKNIQPKGYKADFGILLDMVGAKNAKFAFEGYSTKYAKRYQDQIWTLAGNMGYGDLFIKEAKGGIVDDHVYVNQAGIPMVDIINLSGDNESVFGHYHHTHDDNMNNIDMNTLRRVGQVVTAVLYKKSEGSF